MTFKPARLRGIQRKHNIMLRHEISLRSLYVIVCTARDAFL